MASLVLRPNSPVHYIQFMIAGRARRISTGTEVLQVAKEKLRQFESAQAKGDPLPLPTHTPIGDMVGRYVEHIRSVKTAKSAQTDVYYLRDMFGPICDALTITSRKISAKVKKRPPKAGQDRRRKGIVIEADCFEQITTANIVGFISGRKISRGLAPKTANRYREILVRLFNWAMTQQGIRMSSDKNPAAPVDRYKESAPEISFLSLKEIDQQLTALADNAQLQTMVAVLIYAGLRREELVWLTHDDLDLATGTFGMIRVRAKTVDDETWQPKTKKNRAVPVSSHLRRSAGLVRNRLRGLRPRFLPVELGGGMPLGRHSDLLVPGGVSEPHRLGRGRGDRLEPQAHGQCA
jgi:integrase